MAALEAAPYLPPKSSLESSKSLEHWRTEIVPERSPGVQNVPIDARNNFSFDVSFRKCHLTHQDTTCPPSLALDPRRTGRVLERSLGVQDDHMDARNDFSFHVPIRKCHLTHQDSSCPPSLELYPWRTGRFPDMSLHESLKLSETVKFCTPGGQNVNSNKSVTNYYYGVTLQNLSID